MDKRLKICKIIMITLLLLLIFRAGYLQLIKGEYYYQLSEGNRISYRPINAPRGNIYASINDPDNREDYLLVNNRLSYNIYVLPNEIPREMAVDDVLAKLAGIIRPETQDTEEAKYQLLKNNYQRNQNTTGGNLPVLIKRNISTENMLLIEENSHNIPGILVQKFPVREYVYDSLASHILGYVGEISGQEIRAFNSQDFNYRVGDNIGKTGLERYYEQFLRGNGGIEQIEVNNRGQKVRVLATKPPVTGNDIILNIQLELQKKVDQILNENLQRLREEAAEDEDIPGPTGASAIIIEPDTGAIRAMSSIPGYDLNQFARRISAEDYNQLLNNPLQPFLNRNIAEYASGSVFKLITGSAAIELLNINGDTEFVDNNGKFYVPGWSKPFRNWNPVGEGVLDFTRALARSNNIVFYQLGYDLYQEYRGSKLVEYARKFGLDQRTGIDLPNEASGRVPDGAWKRESFGEGWYPGDSVNLSIGQGGLLTTPIQLVNMVSAIASEGTIYRPRLVDKIVNNNGEVVKDFKPEIISKMDINSQTFDIIKEGMIETTTADYGTAGKVFDHFPFEIAGKTGTAQTGVPGENHGWFVGFAPADDPEIAFLVFLEKGYSSGNTLPIVAEILEEYFDVRSPHTEIEDYHYFRLFEQDYTGEINLFNYFDNVFSPLEQQDF